MSDNRDPAPASAEITPRESPGADAVDHFRSFGYVVARNLLSPERVTELTGHLSRLSGCSESDLSEARESGGPLRRRLPSGWTLPDGVTKHPEFWRVVFDEDLLQTVRTLLGPEIRFLQHTDLHVGYSSFNWHRDSVSRTYGEGVDWEEGEEAYAIVRVGIYVKVPDDSGEGSMDRTVARDSALVPSFDPPERRDSVFRLGVVPGTHRPPPDGQEATRRKVERYTGWMSHIYRWVRGENAVPPGTVWIEPKPGDAVIFDPRVIHTGTPVDGPKQSLFLAYGLPNSHARNHVHYYRHLRPELEYEEIPGELADRLRSEGLHFDPPAPESVSGATTESRFLTWIASVAGLRNG